jgi:hypothetical protein
VTFLSLCAGIGGIDLGLERAGHQCIGQVEIDKNWERLQGFPDDWTALGTDQAGRDVRMSDSVRYRMTGECRNHFSGRMDRPSYRRICKMSTEVSNSVWKDSKQKGAHLLLLAALADYSNAEGWSWPSIRSLCQRTRMGERYVQKMLKKIAEDGELEIRERSGSSNVYRVLVGVNPDSGVKPSSQKSEPGFTPPPNQSSPRTVSEPLKEPSVVVPDELKADPEFAEAWHDWHAHRKEKDRRKLTPSTEKAQLGKLRKLGPARAKAAIRHSIEMGYTGLFEPKTNGNAPRTNSGVHGQRTPGSGGVATGWRARIGTFCSRLSRQLVADLPGQKESITAELTEIVGMCPDPCLVWPTLKDLLPAEHLAVIDPWTKHEHTN